MPLEALEGIHADGGLCYQEGRPRAHTRAHLVLARLTRGDIVRVYDQFLDVPG